MVSVILCLLLDVICWKHRKKPSGRNAEYYCVLGEDPYSHQSVMLLRSFAHFIRKPSPYVAVFLAPTVVLVTQQGEAIKMHMDLEIGNIGEIWGLITGMPHCHQSDMCNYEVLIMTPAILLAALRHGFLKIDMIKILILDECHNARGKHPYLCTMKVHSGISVMICKLIRMLDILLQKSIL